MQALVLAGGASKRFKPLCSSRPKPMHRFMGKPLLHYTLGTLKAAGVRGVIIVKGHFGEHIRRYFRDGGEYGLEVRYADQEGLLGIADAMKAHPGRSARILNP